MHELGYSTLSDAFRDLSLKIGKNNYYLRDRRDESDPLTGSHRVGFYKREPSIVVQTFHNGLKRYSFEELTEIVKSILSEENFIPTSEIERKDAKEIIKGCTEEEIELIINGRDVTSRLVRAVRESCNRVFDTRIQKSLKKLYEYRCQICGARAIELYGVDVSEAHHIEMFSLTANNDAKNIMIVCPDHHRIIHKAKPVFNTDFKRFEYANGKQENLMYNIHL
jgi:hypothetical protein